MPPILQYFEAQQENGGTLIVVDPRRTATALWAKQHLPLKPGSDAALANGLLHVLIRDRLIDEAYIRDRTEGFDEVAPDCGRLLARARRADHRRRRGRPRLRPRSVSAGRRRAMVLTARGPEQQAQGVNNTLAYLNLALALGKVGAPIQRIRLDHRTGQRPGRPRARTESRSAARLSSHRRSRRARARRRRLGASRRRISPDRARAPTTCSISIGCAARHSRPVRDGLEHRRLGAGRRCEIERRLKALDFLVVVDFFLSETAQLADVVLPSAQWAEEDGTTTNLEGRVILRRRVFDPPDGVRTDVDVLCALASRFDVGSRFSYARQPEVFDELRRATAGGLPTTPA